MAVDIVPRKATGAALGVVGIASYCAAGIQDVASGMAYIQAHYRRRGRRQALLFYLSHSAIR